MVLSSYPGITGTAITPLNCDYLQGYVKPAQISVKKSFDVAQLRSQRCKKKAVLSGKARTAF
jgi:hypothetical protein